MTTPPLTDRFATWGNVAADPRLFGYCHGYFGYHGDTDKATIASGTVDDPILGKWIAHCTQRIATWLNNRVNLADLEFVCNSPTAELLAEAPEVGGHLEQMRKARLIVNLTAHKLPCILYGIMVRIDPKVADGLVCIQTREDGRHSVTALDVFAAGAVAGGTQVTEKPPVAQKSEGTMERAG